MPLENGWNYKYNCGYYIRQNNYNVCVLCLVIVELLTTAQTTFVFPPVASALQAHHPVEKPTLIPLFAHCQPSQKTNHLNFYGVIWANEPPAVVGQLSGGQDYTLSLRT